MITAWILYVLLVGALVAISAHALEEVCRVMWLPVRWIWLGALLATLGLAALAPLRATLTSPAEALSAVEITRVQDADVAQSARAAGSLISLPGAIANLRQAVQWPLRTAAPLLEGRAGGILALGWLALSLGLLTLGAATLLRYRTSRRSWPLREIAGTSVRVAPAAGPAVLGLVRPEIVVPAWLLSTSPEEQRLVLLHEREHLLARDPLTLAAGCLVGALIPWNPAIWWMLWRLRLAVEMDCDARVLRQGVLPHAYGSMLIDIAGRGSGLSLGVPALAGSPSTLERRLLAMSTRFPRFAGVRAAAFGVLGGAALLAACDTKLPTAAEIEQMDVAAVESQAKRLLFVTPEGDGVTYFLDGVEVSAEEARAIAGDRIAHVEVLRATDTEGARIRLRSHSADARNAVELGAPAPAADGERRRQVVIRSAPAEGEGDRLVLRGLATGERQGAVVPVSDFEGLLLVDGVPTPTSELRRITPNRIEKIEVIKGSAATQVSNDPRAAHGVIRVTTKQGTESR